MYTLHNHITSLQGLAVKKCTRNGTWSLKNGVVWTDYTACLDTHVSTWIRGVCTRILYAMPGFV